MTPRFITVGQRQIHVHSGGSGPPVVLLHPSPLSGRAVMPMADALRQRFTVHAIDTPGYGLSDAPDHRPESLDEYLDDFLQVFDALGIGRCAVYGAATGAQLGIALARRAPQRVALLVLDSAGHFDADETERIVGSYFPDLAPRDDGSHLATTWTMVRDLFAFFPWCDRRPSARLDRDLPPIGVMQDFLLDYLRAGERYDWAYRPAFYHERVERAREVTVPALLVRWPSSAVLGATDAMIAAGLPANFGVLHPGPAPAERYACVAAALLERWGSATAAAPSRAQVAPAGRFASAWLDGGDLRLHARARRDGVDRPLLLLHGAGGSAAAMERRWAPQYADRPRLCIDLPGHGESGPWPGGDPAGALGSLADHLATALARVGFDDFDAVAGPLGQRVLDVVRARGTARPRLVSAVDPLPPRTLPLPEWLQRHTPDLAPGVDGTHLWRAWHHARDAALWSPWWQRARAAAQPSPLPPAAELHARVVDLMKAAPAYAAAIACEYAPAENG